ncbi:hypothetical protein D3C71_1603470 [compost metagenome]
MLNKYGIKFFEMRSDRHMEDFLKERRLDYRSIKAQEAEFAGSMVLKMADFYDHTERLAWLEKVLEREKKDKILDLINRINKVVGSIKDASNLSISPTGNINGFIVGDKGKAYIETIGAGGYNIQCYHFRTLVNKVK